MSAPVSGLMFPKQAAAFLGVSVATLATWRVRRSGPAYVRVGRGIRYKVEELTQWIDANSIQPLDAA